MVDHAIVNGIYQYRYKIEDLEIPPQLKDETMSSCAALLNLLMGKIQLYDLHDNLLFDQNVDYTQLDYVPIVEHRVEDYNIVLGVDDICSEDVFSSINAFFLRDRRNEVVYENLLHEIAQYFIKCSESKCDGFVHLYRALEYMTYTFPMIYAASSSKYLGTYNDLQRFFANNVGPLKFYSRFLESLYNGDPILDCVLDIPIPTSCSDVLSGIFNDMVNIEETDFDRCVLQITFRDMLDVTLTLRNRYFHMLSGDSRDNFIGIDFEINDVFDSFNPYILNWLAVVFVKIIKLRIQSECH